jgi:flavorubredoxin
MSESTPASPQRAYIVRGLPRLVLPDLAWLGGCSNSAGWPGPASRRRPITHEPCVAYLILGAQKTVMLDTGHFAHWHSLEGQIEQMLQGRRLDYVFVSHQEIPHTGNLGRLLGKHPQAKAVGDVRDYHLFHPEVALERLVPMRHGEALDIGDRQIVFLDALWKDLDGTMWAYDTRLKMLFGADIFGYIHQDDENICGTMLHEMSPELAERASERAALPFFGLRQRSQTSRVAAFRRLLERYPVDIITSGHTAPIMAGMTAPIIEKMLAKLDSPTEGPRYLQS